MVLVAQFSAVALLGKMRHEFVLDTSSDITILLRTRSSVFSEYFVFWHRLNAVILFLCKGLLHRHHHPWDREGTAVPDSDATLQSLPDPQFYLYIISLLDSVTAGFFIFGGSLRQYGRRKGLSCVFRGESSAAASHGLSHNP